MRMFVIGCLLAYILWQHLGAPDLRPAAGMAWTAAQTAIPAPRIVPELPAPAPPVAVAPTPVAAAPMPAPATGVGLTASGPTGCPVLPPPGGRVVMTQGYGVGSHAPAEVWGAIDLAIDGDGDGTAEPGPSWGAVIVATHAGRVTVTPNSHPAGNHVWVVDPGGAWRTGYAHLESFLVSDGQQVEAGTPIGALGSTGLSSGPHLDYQVWVSQGGTWMNIDPTGLVGCE